MAELITTDPGDIFGTSPFGFGPFPEPGEAVTVIPPNPPGGGYGGVGYDYVPFGGTGYGLGSYGDRWFPAPPFLVDGGYGGDPYGFGPYGTTEDIPPQVSGAVSLDGFRIEVFFSEEMNTADPALLDPLSYTLTPVFGAAPSTASSVVIGQMETIGATSVIVTHTGTTLGGTYQVTVSGPTDIAGNPILPVPFPLLTKGDPPDYTVTTPSDTELLFTFDQDMLPVASYPVGAVDTIEDAASYGFESTPDYPIQLTPQTITFPYTGDDKLVHMDIQGMTSLSYDAIVSPADAIDYDPPDVFPPVNGTVFSTGAAVGTPLIVSGELDLSVTGIGTYGFHISDVSGKLIAGSTFRADYTIDRNNSFGLPVAVTVPDIVKIRIEDGAVELVVDLGWNAITQLPLLTVSSAASFSQTFSQYDWTTGENIITLIRNQKADIATVLFNGTPIFSTLKANLVAPIVPQGAGVTLRLATDAVEVTAIDHFLLKGIFTSASSTVFSSAWNFLHGSTSGFMGLSGLTNDTLTVLRGPLTKDWGDGTPATAQDVAVYVAGTPVDVAAVNPYTGTIYTTIPIPLLPAGVADVTVDYTWMAAPAMALAGLNTEGLVLNHYDMTHGHHDPASHGEQYPFIGAMSITKYPMGVVLGPLERPAPKLISHRYMGFEQDYTAMLNSPTTMLLNINPHQYQAPAFEQPLEGVAASFDGNLTPTSANPPWELSGTDAGAINPGEGTYNVIDMESGPFDPDNETATAYHRAVNLNFPSSVFLVGRFQVDTYVEDGVFTGVAFGIHDNHQLYLGGCLILNGVKHLGLLLDAEKPDVIESWQVGPRVQVSLQSQNTALINTVSIPQDMTTGDRFQIIEGTQADVFTIEAFEHQTDGLTLLTVSPDFPAHWDTYGNKYPEIVFEIDWETKLGSYRMDINPDEQICQFSVSGDRTAVITTIDGSAPVLPAPANTSLLLPTGNEEGVTAEGAAFWGSLSRQAMNESTWSFYRYGIVPDVTTIRGHSASVDTEMGMLPQVDPDGEWLQTANFGYSEVTSGDVLLVKKTSDIPNRNVSLAYARFEPFLGEKVKFDYTAKFRVESGIGLDGRMVISDTVRETLLSTLLYWESTDRSLLQLGDAPFTGLYSPVDQGWVALSGSTLEPVFREHCMMLTQDGEHAGGYATDVDDLIPTIDEGGRIFEMRMSITSYTTNLNGDTGIFLAGEFGTAPNYRAAFLTLKDDGTPGVLLRSNGVTLATVNFDWTDGELHTYRLVADEFNDAVILYIDDTLMTSLTAGVFSAGSGNQAVLFGALGQDLSGATDSAITATVGVNSVSGVQMAPSGANRTLGVFLGDRDNLAEFWDIDQWEIPRTDISTAPNSSMTGPIIEEMDWRNYLEVRVFKDPTWGISVLRPDIALPPYYDPEQLGVAGTGFATERVEPSAGWINVEYRKLPPAHGETFGVFQFGALGAGVTQQRWDYARYRVFDWSTEDLINPQGMVLNRYNIITSGELTRDITLENVVTETLDDRRLSFLPIHMYADRVYKIVDGSTILTSEMWEFDQASQLLTLLPDPDTGDPRTFSAMHAIVTVIYVPGKPITNTYLLNQPVLDGVTNLNEGTPPFPTSMTEDPVWKIWAGGAFYDPDQVGSIPASDTLSDPHKEITFTEDPDILYEQMEFFEVADGGQTDLISFPCDGDNILSSETAGFDDDAGDPIYSHTGGGTPLGGVGDSANLFETGDHVGAPVGGYVLDLQGTLYWENMRISGGSGSKGVTSAPANYFRASGGNFEDGVLGEAVLHGVPTASDTKDYGCDARDELIAFVLT